MPCASQGQGSLHHESSDGGLFDTERWVTLVRLGEAQEDPWVCQETLNVLLGHVLM